MQLSIAMLNKRALEIALLEMDTQLQLRELARPRPPPPPATLFRRAAWSC